MALRRNVLDKGWSWIVLGSAFLVMALSQGLLLSLTVYLEELKLEFDIGSREAGMLTGTCLAFTTITSPVASYVCNKIGFRATFISSGILISLSLILSSITTTFYQMLCTTILTGIGFSFAYTPGSVVMGFYFRKRYVLANGVVFSGIYAGIFTFPALFEYLRSFYTWRVCYRLIGAVSLHICVAGTLVLPVRQRFKRTSLSTIFKQGASCNEATNPPPINYQTANTVDDKTSICLEEDPPDEVSIINVVEHRSINESFDQNVDLAKDDIERTHISVRQLLSCGTCLTKIATVFELRLFLSLDFLIMFMIMYVFSVGYMGTIVHFVSRSEWVGFTSAQSGFLLSLMGIGGVFSRLTHGFIIDKKLMKATHMYFLTLLLTGIFVLSLTFMSSYMWNEIMSIFIGITSGTLGPLGPVIMKDIVGLERFNSAFGLSMVAYGLADFTGSLFTGWIYDLTNDYDKAFYMTSACLLSASFLMIIAMIIDKNNRHRPTSRAETPSAM